MTNEYKPGGRPKKAEKTVNYILLAGEPDEPIKYQCVECAGPVPVEKLELHGQYIHRATIMRVDTSIIRKGANA